MLRDTCTSVLPRREINNLKPTSNVENYGNWLDSMEWDYYCTFTTDYSLSNSSARRAMDRLLKTLIHEFGSITYFWVAEPFDCKEGCHTHALIKIPSPLYYSAVSVIEKKWHQVTQTKKTRGYHKTHVMPYVKGKGAHFYLSKYLNTPNADYDFSF